MTAVRSRLVQRLAAVAILLAALGVAGDGVLGLLESYAAAREDLAAKRQQLSDLADLAQAREDFARLTPKNGKTSLIVTADAAQDAIAKAVAGAAADRQVIVDGIDSLPQEKVGLAIARVRLRSTHADLVAFLQSIDDQTPYLMVRRLEMSVARAAAPENAKPLVLASDIQLAAVLAPAAPAPAQPANDGGTP